MTDKYEFQVGTDAYEVRDSGGYSRRQPKEYGRTKIKRVMKRFVETTDVLAQRVALVSDVT